MHVFYNLLALKIIYTYSLIGFITTYTFCSSGYTLSASLSILDSLCLTSTSLSIVVHASMFHTFDWFCQFLVSNLRQSLQYLPSPSKWKSHGCSFSHLLLYPVLCLALSAHLPLTTRSPLSYLSVLQNQPCRRLRSCSDRRSSSVRLTVVMAHWAHKR